MSIGGPRGSLLPRSREKEGRPQAPLVIEFGSAYGVGSGYEPPKMSVFPNVAGQSCCGAGRVGSVASPAAVPSTTSCRYASIAGQSAALRASFQVAIA
jgi:hypothetical protein